MAAAIAAVVAVSVAQPNGPRGRDDADPPAGDDAVRLGTMIVAATDRAAEETVVHSVSDEIDPDAADGETDQLDEEAWVDWSAPGANVRQVWRDQDGTVVSESAGTFLPPADVGRPPGRSIDHVHHTFSDNCVGENGIIGSGEDVAAMISRELAKGHYFQDGTEVVDGEELLVVRIRSGIGESGEWESSSRSALYVDPDTHLPVGQRIYDEDGRLTHDETVEYLPRTPENLALTTAPPVPAGYTRVGRPIDDC
jgi:hypothetical protein